MATAYLTIGLPGSGKTTFFKKFCNDKGIFYICPDDIRKRVNGSWNDQSNMKEIWEIAFEEMKVNLLKNIDIGLDSTLCYRADREKTCKYLRDLGIENIEAIYVNTDLETSLMRNKNRDKFVPEYVLEKYNNSLLSEPPNLKEGFSKITILSENSDIL
jgi:predicted kinase